MVASASQPASQPVVLESQFAGTCMAVVVVVLYMLAGLLLVCRFVSVVHVVRPCHAASRLFYLFFSDLLVCWSVDLVIC